MLMLEKLVAKFTRPKTDEIEQVKEEMEKRKRTVERIDAEIRMLRRQGKHRT